MTGRLMDARTIRTELGVTRWTAAALMRQLPKVVVPGIRKTWIRRRDLERLLEQSVR